MTTVPLATLDGSLPALRRGAVLAVLALALAVMFVVAVGMGPVSIGAAKVLAVLLDAAGLPSFGTIEERERAIIMAIRLPRACLAVLVGAGLALAGALLQGLFRNPLADPQLIGVSGGAAFAAVGTIVLGGTLLKPVTAMLGVYTLPVAAFLGCLTTTALMYRLSTIEGRTFVATMLLSGIAINALAMAGLGFFVFMSDDRQLRDITFWMMGSLGGATWKQVMTVAPFILLPCVLVPGLARALNAFILGERDAVHLGFDIEATKFAAIGAVALAVGAAVAVSGTIGFVGLVVPHLIRLLGGADHRLVLPGSALIGGVLLLAADLLARIAVAPAELPIGLVTSALGGPFFLWLLLSRRRTLG
jgi:iron complex transport system permease protein